MYTDALMKYSNTKFDLVLVKGRARPQFAVWAFLSGLIKPKALVYMFDTASGGRKHYKTAEDFFNVKLETHDGKGIKVLQAKNPKICHRKLLRNGYRNTTSNFQMNSISDSVKHKGFYIFLIAHIYKKTYNTVKFKMILRLLRDQLLYPMNQKGNTTHVFYLR